MKIRKIYFFVLFFSLGSLLFSCRKSDDTAAVLQAGDLISSIKMTTISTADINSGLSYAGAHTTLVPEFDVDMIKLTYSTSDKDGQATTASGALFIPKTDATFPFLSYHHGTLVKRTNVPTYMGSNSTEGMVGALGASIGFISCLPDYLGLGDSQIAHPYLQSELSASASIDMLKAAKNYCSENGISFNKDLYICGYSEGGYVTLATQKKIEASYASEFNLKASAPMAGPYDVEATADRLLNMETYNSPALIGFIIYAYAEYYDNVNLNAIFKSPYASQIQDLFDGTKNLASINASLTTDMSALLNQSFVDDFSTNPQHTLRLDFRENSLLNWSPKSPIRFYHSMEDEIVPYSISVSTQAALSAKSSSTVELVSIPTGSHTGAAVDIIVDGLEWFNSIKQ